MGDGILNPADICLRPVNSITTRERNNKLQKEMWKFILFLQAFVSLSINSCKVFEIVILVTVSCLAYIPDNAM